MSESLIAFSCCAIAAWLVYWFGHADGVRAGRTLGYRHGRYDERRLWTNTILAEYAALPGSDPGQAAQSRPSDARHAAFWEPSRN